MPFIDYYRRDRQAYLDRELCQHEGCETSLRPSLLSATITPMALIALSCANDEGNVRRVLPERGHSLSTHCGHLRLLPGVASFVGGGDPILRLGLIRLSG